jgi:hypothetical protein
MLPEAGLAPFPWGGLRLVVAHNLAPGHGRLGGEGDFLEGDEPRPIRGHGKTLRLLV